MARTKLREIAEAALFDPRQALWDSIGNSLDGLELFHNEVMVATYIKPPRQVMGADGKLVTIHLTDRAHAEDRFQGKCGMVVKLGPLAFKDDDKYSFAGIELQIGDWVFYRASDGLELFSVDQGDVGTPVRIFLDSEILGRVQDPSVIW